MENQSYELEINLLYMTICMALHLSYIALLVKIATHENGGIRPISVMILCNEGIKFAGTVGYLVGTTIVSIWLEVSHEPGLNYYGNGSLCKVYVYLLMLGGFLNVVEGTSKLDTINLQPLQI